MQVCDRCKGDIGGKVSGIVLHHHDVDVEGATNGGAYKRAELCQRCYRVFQAMFRVWLTKGKRGRT